MHGTDRLRFEQFECLQHQWNVERHIDQRRQYGCVLFGTSLHVNGDNSLTVSNFQFTTNSSCFVSGETESGSFTLSGNFNGAMNGNSA